MSGMVVSGPICPKCGSNGSHNIITFWDKPVFDPDRIHCMACETYWKLERWQHERKGDAITPDPEDM